MRQYTLPISLDIEILMKALMIKSSFIHNLVLLPALQDIMTVYNTSCFFIFIGILLNTLYKILPCLFSAIIILP